MTHSLYLLSIVLFSLSLTACVNYGEKATESSLASTQEQAVEAPERVEATAAAKQTAPAAPVPQEQAKPIDDEHQKAVNELKNRLAKIDGMKVGPKEFYSFSHKYLEKENVIEHKWKQSIVPKEAADQEVLKALKQQGIKNEKTIIKDNSELINLMLPLKPTIRCIVYYPDDTEMFRVSFPFNELYFDN